MQYDSAEEKVSASIDHSNYSCQNLIILIPVRLASSRLPRKALVDIHGKPKLQRIYEHILQANIAPVYIVAGDQEIVDVASTFTQNIVLTDPELPSGTDRIQAGLNQIDPQGKYPFVMNFQGDAINTNPKVIGELMNTAQKTGADITTAALKISREGAQDPNVVKIAMGLKAQETVARALYFSRSPIPYDRDGLPGAYYHHLGLYLYTRKALQQFVSFPPGILEQREKLEQLRALEHGMSIYVKLFDSIKLFEGAPADIDTPEDLAEILRLPYWK